MDNYNDYKTNELLQLLEFLGKEERLSVALFIRKEEIRKITAKKLNVSVEDVIKLSTKKKMEEEQKKMKRHYFENKIILSIDKIQIQINELNNKIDKTINGNDDIPLSNEYLRGGL